MRMLTDSSRPGSARTMPWRSLPSSPRPRSRITPAVSPSPPGGSVSGTRLARLRHPTGGKSNDHPQRGQRGTPMSEGIVNTNGAADVRTDHQIVDDDAAIAFETRAGGGPRPYS